MNRVRKFFRLVKSILKRVLSEFKQYHTSVAQIITHLIDKGILFIELKYHCLEIRRRMSDVRSHNEWQSYAKLLDYLESTEKWKYDGKSDRYDYERLDKRRKMMKYLRES